MNEDFIGDVYSIVSANGFDGDESDFKYLYNSNPEFQKDVFSNIKDNGGFDGELEDMLKLSGISLPEKKSPDEPLESSLEETSTDTTEESGAGEEPIEAVEESSGSSITNSYLGGGTLGIVNTKKRVKRR